MEKKTIEHSLQNRILYIGDEIPEALTKDSRPKFIILGTPQEVIDETTNSNKSFHEMVCWIAEYAYKKANPSSRFKEPPSVVYEQVERDFGAFLASPHSNE